VKAPDRTKILELVYASVDEVNQQLRRAQRLAKSEQTVISGEGGHLDSLGLVNLVFATEQKIEQELGVSLNLADGASLTPNPFHTLGSLVDYIHSTQANKLNG
jgi:acyl carrier protein